MVSRSSLVRLFVLISVLVALLASITSFALATETSSSYIVNTIAHLGGDKLISTPEGYRLVNQFGEELWFFPIDEVYAALIESAASNACIELEEGRGTYGPATLHATAYQGMGVTLRFSGMDEHGKWNTFYFNPGGTDANWQPLTSVMGPDGAVLAPTFSAAPVVPGIVCPSIEIGATVTLSSDPMTSGWLDSIDTSAGTAVINMGKLGNATVPCTDVQLLVMVETRSES
jgi:hypothetical protein